MVNKAHLRGVNNSHFLFIGAVIVIVGIIGVYFIFFNPPFPTPRIEFSDSTSCVSLSREGYHLPPPVFSTLPFPPSCFTSTVALFHSGSFSDISFFTADYYRQPEFFPAFATEGLSKWHEPITTHYGAVGYGSYPFSSEVTFSPGGSQMLRFFLHSGFGVRSHQVGKLIPVFENSHSSSSITASLDSTSSSMIVLEPNFPVFQYGWVHPVDVTVSVSPTASSGRHVVVLQTAPVSPELFNEVQSEVPGMYYQLTDFTGARAVYSLTINVK